MSSNFLIEHNIVQLCVRRARRPKESGEVPKLSVWQTEENAAAMKRQWFVVAFMIYELWIGKGKIPFVLLVGHGSTISDSGKEKELMRERNKRRLVLDNFPLHLVGKRRNAGKIVINYGKEGTHMGIGDKSGLIWVCKGEMEAVGNGQRAVKESGKRKQRWCPSSWYFCL